MCMHEKKIYESVVTILRLLTQINVNFYPKPKFVIRLNQ